MCMWEIVKHLHESYNELATENQQVVKGGENKMVTVLNHPEKASALFEGWQETLIWSCLQGVMGEIYADSPEMPRSAMAVLGDFGFLAGKPNPDLVLQETQRSSRDFLILVPQTPEWAEVIEACYGKHAKKVTRFAIKKEEGVFDPERLQDMVSGLPKGYDLQMMDKDLFFRCREIEWCRDWVAQYDHYELYQKYGLGAVIVKDGEPVSGASSYSGYLGGIEIEIGTREDYRRKGLASICGAKLILECLKRGWYPSWDAQNRWSVGLAEKLGYHFDREYTAYEIRGREDKEQLV